MINVKFFLDVLKIKNLFLIYKTNVFIKLLKLMITFRIIIFYILIFIFSLIVFVSNRKHLLVTLIRLEFIVLVIYVFIFFMLNYLSYDYYYRIIFLSFRVCEGSLGLSILVSLIRTHGNDYFQTYNVIQC